MIHPSVSSHRDQCIGKYHKLKMILVCCTIAQWPYNFQYYPRNPEISRIFEVPFQIRRYMQYARCTMKLKVNLQQLYRVSLINYVGKWIEGLKETFCSWQHRIIKGAGGSPKNRDFYFSVSYNGLFCHSKTLLFKKGRRNLEIKKWSTVHLHEENNHLSHPVP